MVCCTWFWLGGWGWRGGRLLGGVVCPWKFRLSCSRGRACCSRFFTSSGLGIRVKLPQWDLSHTFHFSLITLWLGERLRSYDLHTTTLGHSWSSGKSCEKTFLGFCMLHLNKLPLGHIFVHPDGLTSNKNNFMSVMGKLNLRFEELYWSKRID